jgi:hypothetical protein
MTRLKYTLIETEANWEEHLYDRTIQIVGGIAEVDDDYAVMALKYRGFVEIAGESSDDE